MSAEVNTANPARGRRNVQLWLLVTLFALPSLAAWFFYLNPDLLPQGRSNRGDLIVPPLPLGDLSLTTPDQQILELSRLQPNWTLLTLAGPSCDQVCRDTLTGFRQIRKALAANENRLQRLLVLTAEITPAAADRLHTNFPGTHIAYASKLLLDRLSRARGAQNPLGNQAFIIDPRGNLMLQYPAGGPAKDILKDLEKLMKASKSWVKGAQYGHQ